MGKRQRIIIATKKAKRQACNSPLNGKVNDYSLLRDVSKNCFKRGEGISIKFPALALSEVKRNSNGACVSSF